MTNDETSLLSLLKHRRGIDATPRALPASDRKAIRTLIDSGYVKQTKPTPWAKHGTYAITEKGKAVVL